MFLRIAVFIVFLSIGRVAFCNSYDFMSALYQANIDWQSYGNRTAPFGLVIAGANSGSTWSIYFMNAGTNIGVRASGSFSDMTATPQEYVSTGQNYTAVDGGFTDSGNNNFTAVFPEGIPQINPAVVSAFSSQSQVPARFALVTAPFCNSAGSWGGFAINLVNADVTWIATGDCVDQQEDAEADMDCSDYFYTCPTPTPPLTPTPTPTPTPNPTVAPTPPPPLWTPHPQPTPLATVVPDVVVGDVEGSFSYDAETGIGTISVSLKQDVEMVTVPDEIYNNELPEVDSNIPLSLDDERGTDDSGAVVDSLVGQVDNVLEDGKDSWFKPVVDSFLDVVFEHPFLEYFRTAADIQTSDSICSVSIDLFGSTITFGFCDLDDELALLKAVILVVATVYGAFIVIRGD